MAADDPFIVDGRIDLHAACPAGFRRGEKVFEFQGGNSYRARGGGLKKITAFLMLG
jgi:hypothetical protein